MHKPKSSDLPAPNDLGAPRKYSSWRDGQDNAVEILLRSKKRFEVLALPTGMGKSLVYMTYGIFEGARTLVLTSTKGLQDQLMHDFKKSGLKDVRGMGNYPCRMLMDTGQRIAPGIVQRSFLPTPDEMCDNGPCLDGEHCDLKKDGCDYFDAVGRATSAQLVVTNYAFWFTQHKSERSIGNFDVIVCDEAHEVPDEVSNYLKVDLTYGDVRFGDPAPVRWEDWKRWTGRAIIELELKVRDSKGFVKRKARNTLQKVKLLSQELNETWVIEHHKFGYSFEPIWPADYMEDWLFQGIPKVVMASATVRPKTLELMGLKPEDYNFVEFPSPLPVARRPVYHIPTVMMSHKTTDANLRFWVTRIDQIIAKRLDRKGIIHTVSYARARFLKQWSEYRDLMLIHETKTAREVVEAFKQSDPPSILVSPSVHTGFDFPHDQCRYQIIGKVPYPDTRPAIMQARTSKDKDYPAFLAMVSVVQAVGRGMRAPDDLCENFIVDDNIKWMLAKYRSFVPKFFMDAYRPLVSAPAPPKL